MILPRKRGRLVILRDREIREATTQFSKAEARPDESVRAKCILRAHGGETPFFLPLSLSPSFPRSSATRLSSFFLS